jgi:hypothetical protein
LQCEHVELKGINEHLHKLFWEIVLALWFVIRGLELFTRFNCKKRPGPGELPVRCSITSELCLQISTTILVLCASGARFYYVYINAVYYQVFQLDNDWPPPYLPALEAVVALLTISQTMYTYAILTCCLRFATYYSVMLAARRSSRAAISVSHISAQSARLRLRLPLHLCTCVTPSTILNDVQPGLTTSGRHATHRILC